MGVAPPHPGSSPPRERGDFGNKLKTLFLRRSSRKILADFIYQSCLNNVQMYQNPVSGYGMREAVCGEIGGEVTSDPASEIPTLDQETV